MSHFLDSVNSCLLSFLVDSYKVKLFDLLFTLGEKVNAFYMTVDCHFICPSL